MRCIGWSDPALARWPPPGHIREGGSQEDDVPALPRPAHGRVVLRLPAWSLSRRRAHRARTARRVRAARSPAPTTGRASCGGAAGDGSRHAHIECLRRQADRMHDDQELLKALAVPIPAARTGTQASAENRAARNGKRSSCGNIRDEFARGLFHSDGWRGVNRVRRTLADGDHWYEYPRYHVQQRVRRDILRLCGEALDRLGVAWRYSRRNSISVARREAVARLDEFVGPK